MNFPPLDHPKTCACAICTGALALEDCASLRSVDVVELRKLMAGVQAGFSHASRRRIHAVTPNGVAQVHIWVLNDRVDELLRKLLHVHPDAPPASKVTT